MKPNLIISLAGSLTAKLFAAVLLGLAAQTASAQNGVWTNKANGNWSAAINWAGGTVASGQDNTADFASVTWTNGHQTILDGNYTVGTLKFGSVGNLGNTNYLVGANTLTLQTSTGNPTINASNQNAIVGVPLSSSQQVNVTGNVIAITNAANNTGQTGGWILQAGQEGFLGQSALGGGPVTVGNAVGSGQTGFNMIDTAAAGTAPVVLTNNFTIQTIRWIVGQNGCTLNVQPVTILGNVYLNSGASNVRDIANQTTLTLGGVVSGGGNYGLIISTLGGTLNLTNSGNTFGPAITLNVAGTIGATSDGALGFFNNPIKFTSASATFTALSSFTISASRQIVFTAAGTLNTSTNILEVDCPITGAGTITKNGTGTLNLAGANTFSGGVTLNAGTLEVSSSGSLTTSAGFTVLTNTVLLLQDSAYLPNAAFYTVNNGGKFVLAGSPTIKAAAPITVNAGGLFDVSGLSSAFTLGSGEVLSGNGSVNGSLTAGSGSTISGNLLFTNTSATITAGSGSLIIPGTAGTAGTLVISNSLALNGQTIQFDLTTNVVEGGLTNDEIVVGGNLSLSGGETILVNYVNGSLSAGTYKLIKFGGTLTGNFALATTYPNVTIDNGVGTPGYVTLVVSATSTAQNLIWQGDGAANVWNVSTTPNWVTVLGGPTTTYNDPSKVTFNDFGSNNVPVTLNATVLPNLVTFNITNKAYTLTGSGNIHGTTSLTINGGNTLTNLLQSDYTGGTVLNNASKLVLGNGGSTGSAGSGNITMGNTTAQVIVNESGSVSLPTLVGSGGTPQIIQNGSGTTTLTGITDNSYLGAVVNNGILNLGKTSSSSVHALGSATTVNTGGTLQLGGSGGNQIYTTVTVTMAGGTFDPNSQNNEFTALNGYGTLADSTGSGTLTLSAAPSMRPQNGTLTDVNVNLSLTNTTAAGFQVQSGGTFNLEGGTVNYPSSTASAVVAGGVFNMSGGTLTGSTYFALGSSTTANAVANFSGGHFVNTGEFLQCIDGNSVVTISSNATLTLNDFSYGDTGKTLTNYFYGGLVNTKVFHQRGTGNWAAFFNGGTIQANATVGTFMPDTGTFYANQIAFISTNGLIMDCQSYNIGISQNLLHDPALGINLDGGLTKLGTGTLTLTGTNTFNGSISNAFGTIVFNNAGSYNNVFIGDNATNQINVVSTTTSLTNATLTIGQSGAGTQGLFFNLGSLGNPVAPLITVPGTVTNSGNVVVTLAAPVLTPGTVPLLKYGSMNAANFAATWSVTPVNFVTLTLTNDTVHNLVSIIVVPGVTPNWVGNNVVGGVTPWDIVTPNWKTNGVATLYLEPSSPGQPVTFNDTASNFSVDISAATVDPLFINMTNGSHDYTFTGSAGIGGGTGALVKSGAGALILNNAPGANTYPGVTTVNGGSVVAAQPNVLSPNSAMTFNNSSLNISNNSQSFASLTLNNTPLLGNGTLTGGSGATLAINNAANLTLGVSLAGPASLIQNGTDEITLTNSSSYTGSTTVNSGSLRVQNGAALGTGGFVGGNGTTINTGARVILDGSFSIPEAFGLNGAGPDGAGCLMVTNGNVLENGSPCQCFGATLYVSAGSSIDFQGDPTRNASTLYGGSYTKSGPGDLLVGGFPGNTSVATPVTVAQGRLMGTNCNVTGFITVNSGATLAGNGPFNGGINVLAGGNLAPNMYGTTATMTSSAGLTNAGVMTLQLLKTATATNADQISCSGYFTNSGTLTVITNVNSTLALAVGDSFKLFTLTNYAALTGLTPTLPALPTGLGWTNKLAVNGTIAVVVTVSTAPFALGTSVSGNQLTLTWPTDHTGWRLQVQTNSLSTGLSGTWYDVPGATSVNSELITMDPDQGTVFYRMVYP